MVTTNHKSTIDAHTNKNKESRQSAKVIFKSQIFQITKKVIKRRQARSKQNKTKTNKQKKTKNKQLQQNYKMAIGK